MTLQSNAVIPRSAEALSDFHMALASMAEDALDHVRKAEATLLAKSLLTDDHEQADFVEITQSWRDAAEYVGQGIAPRERDSVYPTLTERQIRVKKLVSDAKLYEPCARLFTPGFEYLWRGVAARGAYDFGGRVSLEGLQLLGNLSPAVVRNAVSTGDLHPDAEDYVDHLEAKDWLPRRREFCPSRWRNLDDDQWPFDPSEVATANDKGMIWIPQATEGDAFTPDRVVRNARSVSGISIMIGAKGSEVQYRDFYEALTALAKAVVPRWRRRNDVGNWGIVRARGAWTAVSKARIDEQLAAKIEEIG